MSIEEPKQVQSMRYHQFVMLVWVSINMFMYPVLAHTQSVCKSSELSADQIRAIVVKERAARDDLPAAFPKYEYTVKKQGCHYIYLEYGLPAAFESYQMFILNQYGVIVDVNSGGKSSKMKCPEKVYSESELTEILKNERERRQDLPPLFSKYKIHVSRLACMYLYYEYNSPERRGDYQVFAIDPYGELMEFSRNEPY